MRGNLRLAAAIFGVAVCGCSSTSTTGSQSGDSRTPATAAVPAPGTPGAAPRPKNAPRAHVSDEEARKARPDLPPDQRALLILGQTGHPEDRWIDAEAAEGAGYTLVDLSDDWTPFIFEEQTAADGTPLSNRYRRIFLGLANDELDEDGEPLEPGAKNYLELYGIPPALGVLRARFVQDEEHPCHDQESADAIDAVETVTYVAPADIKKDERRLAKVREELEKARKKAHLATVEELAEKQPAFAPKVKMLERRAAEKPAMAAVERRLTCEGLLGAKGGAKHTTGIYDDAMRLAVRRFQQKHMIYEANYLRRKTVDALARPLVDNDYDDLTRALRERVVAAAAILEDGSASKTRNLVDEYLKTTLDQMLLPDGATAISLNTAGAIQTGPDTTFRITRGPTSDPL